MKTPPSALGRTALCSCKRGKHWRWLRHFFPPLTYSYATVLQISSPPTFQPCRASCSLEALGYSMTEVNIKTWIPPTASLKKTIAFTGTEISKNLLVLFFLLLLQFFKNIFFSLLSLLIFVGLKQCILLLLILMWRMCKISLRHSFGQVLYGYQSSATYTVVCIHAHP